jgi:hypothetical protein
MKEFKLIFTLLKQWELIKNNQTPFGAFTYPYETRNKKNRY